MLEIKFKKLSKTAKSPYQKFSTDACWDLFADDLTIENEDIYAYHTNIAIEIPEGYVGLLFPRSSVVKYDLALTNSVGVIDSEYRGEICMKYRLTKQNSNKTFELEERIGQIMIIPRPEIKWIESEELTSTNRGEDGYGSTGKN